jgi:hypothetical protein
VKTIIYIGHPLKTIEEATYLLNLTYQCREPVPLPKIEKDEMHGLQRLYILKIKILCNEVPEWPQLK